MEDGAMKVFAYEVTEGTDWISPVPGKAQRQLRELKTQFAPVLDSWNPPTYEYVGRRRSRSADFPWDGYGNLCLRQTAIDVVGHVLKPFGEFLPLALGDEERVWLFHPIGVIPALDLNESSLETFPDGTVGNIDTFHFVEDLVGSRPIFRVPQRVRPFVTDAFVDRVRSSNLTGLRFQLLWDSAWTVRPVPLLIVSGYWSPRGWDE